LFKTIKPQRKPCLQLRLEAIVQAKQWKALIGNNGIETKADLARYLGIANNEPNGIVTGYLI